MNDQVGGVQSDSSSTQSTPKTKAAAATEAAEGTLAEGLELILGWRDGKGWSGGQLPVSDPLSKKLAESCRSLLAYVNRISEPKAFDVDAIVGPEELMVADITDGFASTDKDDGVTQLIPLLRQEKVGEDLTPEGLKARRIAFYAVRCRKADEAGQPGAWVAFINRTDPQISTKPGSFLAIFAADHLDKYDEPVFQFRKTFDVVLVQSVLLVAGWPTFDALFRQVVEAQTGPMIDEFVKRMPQGLRLSQAAIDVLKKEGLKRPRLRARVRGLLQKEYLSQLTPQLIEEEAARQQQDADYYIKAGELLVDKHHPTRLISLLDESLKWGPFSKKLFEVEHKAPAP